MGVVGHDRPDTHMHSYCYCTSWQSSTHTDFKCFGDCTATFISELSYTTAAWSNAESINLQEIFSLFITIAPLHHYDHTYTQ